MGEILSDLRGQGWSALPLRRRESEMAEYSACANAVITQAEADTDFGLALNYEALPRGKNDKPGAGTFGVVQGNASNSGEQHKLWLHAGHLTEQNVRQYFDGRKMPADVKDFLDIHANMLEHVKESFQEAFGQMGADAVTAVLFPDDITRRNVHIRTVRYRGVVTGATEQSESVSGHADRGVASLHLYETHGNWMHGAPYSKELVFAEDDSVRAAAIRGLRRKMHLIDTNSDQAAFFLGTSWYGFDEQDTPVPEHLRDLPVLYHAGFTPEQSDAKVSDYAHYVAENNTDRVVTVAFAHPSTDYPLHRGFTIPTVPMCRPEYQTKV